MEYLFANGGERSPEISICMRLSVYSQLPNFANRSAKWSKYVL